LKKKILKKTKGKVSQKKEGKHCGLLFVIHSALGVGKQ
jgi:hypothetical protein